MLAHDSGGLAKPNFIINFPTKDHWRGKSTIPFIRDGLRDLVDTIVRLEIRSIAVPPLGCGNGGLDWAEVRPIIEEAFAVLPDVEVRLFEPSGAPNPKTMEVRTNKPKMTPGRAAIIKVLDTYRELNYGLSRIEVQKLAYFLQEAGESLNLSFVKHEFGPYADSLRHALNTMEGHFIRGVGDGVVKAEIEPTADAVQQAEEYLARQGQVDLVNRVDRVGRLIEGFQSAYGMELLASVHWVAVHDRSAKSASEATAAIHAWNPRKQTLMRPEHISAAWDRLQNEGWLNARSH